MNQDIVYDSSQHAWLNNMAQHHCSTQHTLLCSILFVCHEHGLSLHALLLVLILMTRSMRFVCQLVCMHAQEQLLLICNLACMPGISDTLMDFG